VTSRNAFISFIVFSLLPWLSGCGLPSLPALTLPTQPTQPISISYIEAPPASMAVNASATVYAAVENSPSNPQALYTVTCGSAGACGSFTASDEGGAIVYKAPSAIPSGGTVTVTATSAADSTKSVSATVTIVPPIPISVSFPGPTPASLTVNAQATFRALIDNDVSANPQVKWTVTCDATACGTFNPTTTTNDGGTTYTAPSAIPPGNTVTVTATSVTDPTKSASATIVITPQAPTLANGAYVFQLSGPAGQNATFTAGVLVAQNGAITGGEVDSIYFSSDSNDDLTPYSFSQLISGGSYGTTPDGNVQITYQAGGAGYTLNGVVASGGNGFVAQLYGSQGSGTLDLQTSAAAPSGGYAVSLYGGDLFADPTWIGGILNIDSAGGISGTGSALDFLGGGSSGIPNGEQSLVASTVSTPDNFGRVEFQLNPGQSSYLPAQNLIGYIVDATHIRLVSAAYTSSSQFQGVMGGTALGQGVSTGKFSSSSLAGTSYVFGAANQTQYSTFQTAGVLTANTGGTLSGTLDWIGQTGNAAQSPLSITGTYTVDSTGRATLNLTDGTTFNQTLHLYLTGDGNGLLLSNSSAETFAGQAFQQQTAAFTAASFSGGYGLNAGQGNNGTPGEMDTVVGSIAATAGNETDTLAGFADSGNPAADFAISGALTASSNGVFTGTLTGLDPASRTAANNFTFYLVDNTRAVAIETDNTQLTLGYLELQQ
jgi:hypothetical protein